MVGIIVAEDETEQIVETYVINASGSPLAVTKYEIIRPGEPGSGLLRSAWNKQDVVDIALYHAKKVSVGRTLAFGLIGALARRTDVTLTFALADGTTRSYTAKNANPAEIATELQLRGWPVNGSKPSAQPDLMHDEDPAEALRILTDLHDHGLLTDEEFAAKRAEIIRRI